MTISKIVTSNNWTQVYLLLKEHILQRKFAPNEKIAIPELASQLGVSPTPIRDALNRLEAEGLIRTVPKVGTFVSPVTHEQISELMESRLMMEWWVIDKWEQLSSDMRTRTVSEMQAIVAKAEELVNPETIELYEQSNLDRDFHLALIQAGCNTRMTDMYQSTMNYRAFNLAGDLITIELYERTVAQHTLIVKALSDGKLLEAKIAIREHLNSSRNNLHAFIDQSGGYL